MGRLDDARSRRRDGGRRVRVMEIQRRAVAQSEAISVVLQHSISKLPWRRERSGRERENCLRLSSPSQFVNRRDDVTH